MGGVEDINWFDLIMDEIGFVFKKADETIQKSVELWDELTKDLLDGNQNLCNGISDEEVPIQHWALRVANVKEEPIQHWAMSASKLPETLNQEQGYEDFDGDDGDKDEDEDEITVSPSCVADVKEEPIQHWAMRVADVKEEEPIQHWAMHASKLPETSNQDLGDEDFDGDEDEDEDETTVSQSFVAEVKEEPIQHYWDMCASKIPETLIQELGHWDFDGDSDDEDEDEDETTVYGSCKNMWELDLWDHHENEEDSGSELRRKDGYELLKNEETSSSEDDHKTWDYDVEECNHESEEVVEMLPKHRMLEPLVVGHDDEESDKLHGFVDVKEEEIANNSEYVEVEKPFAEWDWVYVTTN